MRSLTVAAVQMQCTKEVDENLKKAENMIRKAKEKGAQVILLPELFEREYFCQQRRYDFYEYALPTEENPAVKMGCRLAKELEVVLPISFYEREENVMYNSLAWIDADGKVLGVYRKTHIPDDHFIRKNSILHPEIPVLWFLIRDTEDWVPGYAGISGSPKQQEFLRLRVPRSYFIRLP